MAVVYYAANQRTGGGADQQEVERLRASRAGSLAARTEQDATTTWDTRVDPRVDRARQECGRMALLRLVHAGTYAFLAHGFDRIRPRGIDADDARKMLAIGVKWIDP